MTGKGRPWAPGETKRLLTLRDEGYEFGLIAQKLNRPTSSTKGKYYNIKNGKISQHPRRDWTDKEVKLLLDLAETLPKSILLTTYNEEAIANGYEVRSLPSIHHQLKKLGQSSAPQIGWYTVQSISLGLGFSKNKIKGWLETGKLKSHNEGIYTYISVKDLVKFILDHPTCLNGLSPDGQQWFLALLKEEREAK